MHFPSILLAFGLVVALAVTRVVSGAAGGESQPQLERAADGTYSAITKTYDVRIAADGSILSLIVGDVPILGTAISKNAGAFFVDEQDQPIGFDHVDQPATNELLFSAGDAQLQFVFLADRIEAKRINAGARFANWVWVPSESVKRSLDGLYDRPSDFTTPPFDGYQPAPRWITDAKSLVYMPYVMWMRKEKLVAGHNVAVFSHGFGEGDEKPYVIRPVADPAAPDAVAFDIRCVDPDFLVPRGGSELFSIGVENVCGDASVETVVRSRVLSFVDRKPIAMHDTPLKLARGNPQTIAIPADIKEPGVYRAELSIRNGDRELRKIEWTFGYDWPNWKPTSTRPADFAEFWDSTLKELRSKPLDAVLTPQPDLNGNKVYRVNFAGLGERRVYGWYVVPAGEGPFPAELILPGNGVYKMTCPQPLDRYAVLMIQVNGLDLDLANLPKESPWKHHTGFSYWSEWESRNDAFARIVYTNSSRAVDFLFSRPELNKDAIYVEGGSQGGGLSIITAALNPQLKSAYVMCPGLCRLDWLYPHFVNAPFPWDGQNPKPAGMSDEAFARVMSYYDAANFAPDIRIPVTACVGLQDTITIGGSQLAALRAITGAELTLTSGVWMNHRSDSRINDTHIAWLKRTVLK